jgi:D-beta-D-heptose 7-phosphate kinase/D-beta-D-heptose 1-phosphate adenosyltransferase
MRAEGQTIVLTNGCFDILHVGHTRYLREAAGLGDVLVVGVNSDRSARALKGPGRPVHTEDDRAEVVASLRAVGAVTVFDEDTALELVEAVRPDIYVKGGDYPTDPDDARYPSEARAVRAYGGEVVMVGMVPGRSTTSTLKRIAARDSR